MGTQLKDPIKAAQMRDSSPWGDEPEEERNPWRIAQFMLAAASAVPLLWVGGLHSWPWDHGSTADSSVGAAVADPVRIDIARLKIDAPMDPLTMDSTTQELKPPAYGHAGWSQVGPQPGAVGRAVVEGHRTNPDGSPDVFNSLSEAKTGDKITVTTSNGKAVNFTVTSVETFDTSSVPMDRVFGTDGKLAQLRLIAPSGTATGSSYQEDVVVFADLAS